MAMVECASYRAEAKACGPVTGEELKDAIASFLSRQEILVERKNKEGKKSCVISGRAYLKCQARWIMI